MLPTPSLEGISYKMTEQDKTSFSISQELAQSIVNYLMARPWGEVNGFMVGLSNLKPVDGGNKVNQSAQ